MASNSVMRGMDSAAEEAEAQLDVMLSDMTPEEKQIVQNIAVWFSQHYIAAGYKRLAKVLIATFK